MSYDATARAHWPERLRALREQYRTNPSLHATKTAYINGLEYEYERAHAAGVAAERARCANEVEAQAYVHECADETMAGRVRGAPFRRLAAALRDGPTP